jgi:hypothetical protein
MLHCLRLGMMAFRGFTIDNSEVHGNKVPTESLISGAEGLCTSSASVPFDMHQFDAVGSKTDEWPSG